MVDSFQVGCFTITNLVSNGTLPVLEGDIFGNAAYRAYTFIDLYFDF